MCSFFPFFWSVSLFKITISNKGILNRMFSYIKHFKQRYINRMFSYIKHQTLDIALGPQFLSVFIFSRIQLRQYKLSINFKLCSFCSLRDVSKFTLQFLLFDFSVIICKSTKLPLLSSLPRLLCPIKETKPEKFSLCCYCFYYTQFPKGRH